MPALFIFHTTTRRKILSLACMELCPVVSVSLTSVEIGIRIIASAATKGISACAAGKDIVPRFTPQCIIISTTVDGIVFGSTAQQVVASETVERIITVEAEDQIGASSTVQRS